MVFQYLNGGCQIGHLKLELLDLRQFDVRVSHDRSQMFGKKGIIAVFFQFRAILWVHPFDLGIDRVQIRIFSQQRYRGFGSDALYSRDIVRTVTHQSQIVDELLRAHLIPGENSFRIQHDVLHRIIDRYSSLDQLAIVFISRHIHDVKVLFEALAHGAQSVISLIAIFTNLRHFGQGKEIQDGRDLALHIIRHRGAIGLVIIIFQVPEGGSFAIKGDGQILSLMLIQEREEGIDHTEDGRGVLAPAVDQRITDKGKVCPIEQGCAIDQIKFRFHVYHLGNCACFGHACLGYCFQTRKEGILF